MPIQAKKNEVIVLRKGFKPKGRFAEKQRSLERARRTQSRSWQNWASKERFTAAAWLATVDFVLPVKSPGIVDAQCEQTGEMTTSPRLREPIGTTSCDRWGLNAHLCLPPSQSLFYSYDPAAVVLLAQIDQRGNNKEPSGSYERKATRTTA